MLCYTILFFTMNCYVMICSALHFTAPHCTGPYSTLLYSTLLYYCTMLYYTILMHMHWRETWGDCTSILKHLSHNLHDKNYTAGFRITPRILSENLKNPFKITSQSTQKCIQNPPWDPPWNQTWKKLPNCALKDAPRETKMLPKSTQEGSWALNWRTFAVKTPLLKASLFLRTCLNVF